MTRPTSRSAAPPVALALASLALVGLALSMAIERGSVERANRMHRAGELGAAEELYRARVADDSTAALLRYNLGTALLGLGSSAAEQELVRATQADDERVRGSALYNLGAWALARALDAAAADSVREHALRAVEANREALRLEPGWPEARWNLDLAQHVLDSMDAAEGRAGPESSDGSAESDRLALDDDLRELEEASDPSNAPRRGSDEAPAAGDADALALAEADEVLTSRRTEVSVLLGKLLTFEGRFRPSRPAGATPRW